MLSDLGASSLHIFKRQRGRLQRETHGELLTHTVHGVIRGRKAVRTLFKATASVQVKADLALGTKVFAEARVTVFYSAS